MEPLDSACYADPMIEIAAVLLVIATSVAMLMLLGRRLVRSAPLAPRR